MDTGMDSKPPFPDISNYTNFTLGESSNKTEDHQLYQVPVGVIVLLSILYGTVSVAAFVGNLLVLWIILVTKSMRTVTNIYIGNLAVADIIIGMFTVPFQFQAALLQRWNLPHFLCAFCPFIQVLSVTVSVFTLVAIALDRYKAVMHPLSPQLPKMRALLIVTAIWLIGLAISLPTELDYSVIYVAETETTEKAFCANTWLSESTRTIYIQGVVIVQYFFPLLIICGAYVRMGYSLWSSVIPGNSEENRDALVLRNKKKVIKMLAVVVILFAVCWFPLQTYNFLQTLVPSINSFQYINVLWFCFHWLAMSNSCVNPFIYAIFSEKFQREFRARFGLGPAGNRDAAMVRCGSRYPDSSK